MGEASSAGAVFPADRADGMRVELLYFEGCPSHARLMPRLRQLLDEAGVEDEIALVRVESLKAAEQQRFLGSPTLRIDGEDVDPTADGRSDYGLKCRLYRTSEGQGQVPADDWVRAAIERARHRAARRV